MPTQLQEPNRSNAGLTRRVFSAGMWTFAIRVSLRGLTAVKTVILARVLAPGDIGLFGIALLMLSLLDALTYTGFRSALIQRNDDIRSHLDSAWTIDVIRGLFLAAVLAFTAPWVARFFSAPEATDLIRALSATVLLNALVNVGIVHFERELEFRKRFIFEVSYGLADVVVGIILVLVFRNVWALVYGSLTAATVRLAASYLLHPYRPRLRVERAKAGQLFQFGKWVFGNSVLAYLTRNLSEWLVGRMLGVASLGFYRMGHNLAEISTTEVNRILNQVLFPTYSRLQDEQERLRAAYLRSLGLVTLVSLPITAVALPLAQHFTVAVLGEKWRPMIPAFQVLLMAGAVRSLSTTVGPLFSGVGRPDIVTKIQFVKLVFLAAMAYPATRYWGLAGAAAAFLISTALLDGAAFIIANRMLGSTLKDLGRVMVYPGLCALAAGLAPFGVIRALDTEPSIAGLVLLAGLGFITYVAAVAVCRGLFGYTAGGLLSRRMLGQLVSR